LALFYLQFQNSNSVAGVEQASRDFIGTSYGSKTLKTQSSNSEILITAGFYEPFTAANAIQALTKVGFEDDDIGMLGTLDGPLTNLIGFCEAIGMPLAHALYYQTSFEDGGVLLIVRARELSMRRTALAVLNEQGGILPPTVH
jgi:hypothetical protein